MRKRERGGEGEGGSVRRRKSSLGPRNKNT